MRRLAVLRDYAVERSATSAREKAIACLLTANRSRSSEFPATAICTALAAPAPGKELSKFPLELDPIISDIPPGVAVQSAIKPRLNRSVFSLDRFAPTLIMKVVKLYFFTFFARNSNERRQASFAAAS
jgi:hypothetical protein